MPQSVKEPMLEGEATVMVTFWLLPAATEPEEELTWHQVPGFPEYGVVAVQFKTEVPVFWIVRVWPEGVLPWETPEKVMEEGERTMWGRTTFKFAAVRLHPVALPGPFQPLPVTCTEPGATPLMVLPETEATPLLEELNDPPLQPEGAEAVVFWPTRIVPDDRLTALPVVGHAVR
jgi:hypothetical protein